MSEPKPRDKANLPMGHGKNQPMNLAKIQGIGSPPRQPAETGNGRTTAGRPSPRVLTPQGGQPAIPEKAGDWSTRGPPGCGKGSKPQEQPTIPFRIR